MVYVDNFYDTGVRYRGMKMCHMIADTTEELLDMVDKIGVKRKWIQHPGTCNEHFDICFSKRQKAVKLGAHEIHFKIYAAMIGNRAKEYGIPWTHTSITLIAGRKILNSKTLGEPTTEAQAITPIINAVNPLVSNSANGQSLFEALMDADLGRE